MPVEIRELVVKATIDNSSGGFCGGANAKLGINGFGTNDFGTGGTGTGVFGKKDFEKLLSNLKAEIISECVNRAFEQILKINER